VTIEDVTDPGDAQLAADELTRLRRSETVLRAIVRSSPVAMFALDAHGTVHVWNRASEELFGWPASDAVGGPPPFLESPDELEAVFGIRELPLTEVTDHALLEFNSPDARRAGVPGGGGVTRAAELALFLAFGVTICSIAQTPTPWSQVARLRNRAPYAILRSPEAERFIRHSTTPGEQIGILAPLGHSIAYRHNNNLAR